MGTNYYTFKKAPCPTCAHGGENYHIGKASAGWKFLFASYPDEGLVTAQAWREFLKNRLIRDEYGKEVPYEEFWRTVDNAQEGFETIDPEGYRISASYDFS